ncbi:MAG: polyprenyl synthetase family protein [Verrucomicrobia bacterium]|nr:polyprenyl synthetase family protein [Verrucomicrobiota bacterium]NBT24325.1 polyprenyl synthetase family protein [bacterium]NBV96545.1 polyprenyl synthetase family protein [Verrucomicrobiota bacterium]
MKSVGNRSGLKPKPDWLGADRELEQELKEVERRILHQASLFDSGAETYVRYALEGGGKRLRPALVLLAGKVAGGWSDGIRDLAVIVELVHVASLIHDDVLDRADLRRSRATCNAKWGVELSVLLGDALFAHGLQLATKLENAEVARKIAEASRNLCEGEILQTQRRFDLKMSTADYLHMVGLKTGALFRVAAEVPFLVFGAAEVKREAARSFGQQLGVAYQIYDDCLDLFGSDEESGKTLGTDIAKGKWTLPVLHALQTLPKEESEKLRAQLVGELMVGGVAEKVREAGGLKFALRKAVELLDRAKGDLQVLGEGREAGKLTEMTQRLQEYLKTAGND